MTPTTTHVLQEENVRRKESDRKRQAGEQAEAQGRKKRKKQWWEEEEAGQQVSDDDDRAYYREQVTPECLLHALVPYLDYLAAWYTYCMKTVFIPLHSCSIVYLLCEACFQLYTYCGRTIRSLHSRSEYDAMCV